MSRISDAVVGVDGAKSGWIAVWRKGCTLDHDVFASALDIRDRLTHAEVIAVDVPIGLSDREGRAPDAEARRFVGGRRACSIFSAPVRGILDATSQREASARHRQIDGRGFGAQAFGILPKIREWDTALRTDTSFCRRVFEVHPEVSFAALNGGTGLIASKKRADGHAQRRALLSDVFGAGPVTDLLANVSRSSAAPDDVLDALVALWSAERIATGRACSLPSPPGFDSVGLPVAIWY